MRDLVLQKTEYYLLWEKGVKFHVPYPEKGDTNANSAKELKTIPGFTMLFDTINSELPLAVREAAVTYILKILSDKQLLALLESCIKQAED